MKKEAEKANKEEVADAELEVIREEEAWEKSTKSKVQFLL